MIEKITLDYLKSKFDIPVLLEVPAKIPPVFILIEKTGSSRTNQIESSTLAVQSWADSMYKAAGLNDEVKAEMLNMVDLDEVSAVRLNSDYNYTDTETKSYRYQAVFDITHY